MADPEVKGVQFEDNAPITAIYPRDAVAKGIQFEDNAPITAIYPRDAVVKGIMFEIPQLGSDIALQQITVGDITLDSGDGRPRIEGAKGSLYGDHKNAELRKNVDGDRLWEEIL